MSSQDSVKHQNKHFILSSQDLGSKGGSSSLLRPVITKNLSTATLQKEETTSVPLKKGLGSSLGNSLLGMAQRSDLKQMVQR